MKLLLVASKYRAAAVELLKCRMIQAQSVLGGLEVDNAHVTSALKVLEKHCIPAILEE